MRLWPTPKPKIESIWTAWLDDGTVIADPHPGGFLSLPAARIDEIEIRSNGRSYHVFPPVDMLGHYESRIRTRISPSRGETFTARIPGAGWIDPHTFEQTMFWLMMDGTVIEGSDPPDDIELYGAESSL